MEKAAHDFPEVHQKLPKAGKVGKGQKSDNHGTPLFRQIRRNFYIQV